MSQRKGLFDMHMIRGVQVHGNCKKKLTPKDKRAAIEHERWLKSMGVGKVKLIAVIKFLFIERLDLVLLPIKFQ